jgi:methylated-DNA-[protein]-cysteine S-methyltransferase|tara:strand:- start:52 stop:366 length:315 start_codon:yes stop_codon:yes gene_type:complete
MVKSNSKNKKFMKLKNGTKFEIKVWNSISKIPRGEVRTYKELAIQINRPKSARAVANACGKNPYPVKIPCHRVIRSDGKLGGYSGKGGTKTKKKLLKNEGYLYE